MPTGRAFIRWVNHRPLRLPAVRRGCGLVKWRFWPATFFNRPNIARRTPCRGHRAVLVERFRLSTETVTGQVRKETIEVDDDTAARSDADR